jgi:hypothetical protein
MFLCAYIQKIFLMENTKRAENEQTSFSALNVWESKVRIRSNQKIRAEHSAEIDPDIGNPGGDV